MSFKQKLQQIGQQPDIILIITDEQRATQHFPLDGRRKIFLHLHFLKKTGSVSTGLSAIRVCALQAAQHYLREFILLNMGLAKRLQKAVYYLLRNQL